MDRKCKNCSKWDTQAYPLGFCKAHAPVPTVIKTEIDETGKVIGPFVIVWPSTGADDWCCDFENIST